MISLTKDKRMLGYASLDVYSDIFHFVTTRIGGCSEGTYATFNCSPFAGDERACVRRNQEILFEAMPEKPRELIIPHQTHGTKSLVVDETFLTLSEEDRCTRLEGIDALITREEGCCICVSTADCVPVLLYDRRHQVVAAVHAGWRGTVNFIVGHTLEQMRTVYGTEGSEVVACIGPGISLESFEVGDEVYDTFRLNGFDMSRISYRKAETGKYHIDLWEANRQQLLDFGVPGCQIEVSGICTYIHHDEFFSARRLGITSGRILSGIMKRVTEP